ncbi:MAG TPA: NADH-ubiquinone oxidoreductase-F iron-sulfur binding region domain-containing protein [Solirubrobacteraceae bacterium]|nr:NADH-ubiquinone oxidoreductase-F iron-sulfur binding region domain-containing protein [Solirubrobacteraceae bacterium]
MTGQRGAPVGLPRLLNAIPAHGAMSLAEHLSVHGETPLVRSRRARRGAGALIEEIEQAGLHGRGGAAFPTAVKMRGVAHARGRPIVVVNAAEGEPASSKDHTLLTGLPHLVLDGGVLAAQALGADQVIVCIPESSIASLQSMKIALAERQHAGAGLPSIELRTVPERYVTGQESALVNHLNGGPALPTFTPPLPFERGVRRRPTLVNNTETLAHLALIVRHGAHWFRELGTTAQPGSTLITLSGPLVYPGVYEIEHGASLSSLLHAAGGATTPLRAGLFGGYAGAWIDANQLSNLALCGEHLKPYGASLGAGVIALLSEDACGVAETVTVTRWLAEQSAGQCGPCVHGLDAIATSLEEVTTGTARRDAKQRIARLASLARSRGACGHPEGATRFILSAIEVFAAEFADHARHGPCDACAGARELPLPATPRPAAALV